MDRISEEELLAYVDEQLDVEQRIEIERYLISRPDVAERVMADLRARDQLRLAFAAKLPNPPQHVVAAAVKLERKLSWRRWLDYGRRAAAIAILITSGWIAHAQFGYRAISKSQAAPDYPSYVGEAVRAHRTAILRSQIQSQQGNHSYDPAELLAKTHVLVPTLPAGWQVTDMQIFPAEEGHSVEMDLQLENNVHVSLFAVQALNKATIAPTSVRISDDVAVYWQIGRHAYALTGGATPKDMAEAGMKLFEELKHALPGRS